ncbi:hypothetical protein B0H13DRAFT_1876455 [Mycena leptocephala]|nr:hypothetical protein B0H13DRAFT_1876455 [Mycena leptocephala]
MLLNHFPNITALDLCRGQSEVRKEVTKDLGDTDTCLPDLERIRISWFVDDAEAKKILCGGSNGPKAQVTFVNSLVRIWALPISPPMHRPPYVLPWSGMRRVLDSTRALPVCPPMERDATSMTLVNPSPRTQARTVYAVLNTCLELPNFLGAEGNPDEH